jgi:hypothetical protein
MPQAGNDEIRMTNDEIGRARSPYQRRLNVADQNGRRIQNSPFGSSLVPVAPWTSRKASAVILAPKFRRAAIRFLSSSSLVPRARPRPRPRSGIASLRGRARGRRTRTRKATPRAVVIRHSDFVIFLPRAATDKRGCRDGDRAPLRARVRRPVRRREADCRRILCAARSSPLPPLADEG